MPLMFAQRDPYNVIIKVTDLAQTVITNTEKLKDLDRQVTAIHEWILAHDRQQLINIEVTSGEMHDIKTKLAILQRDGMITQERHRARTVVAKCRFIPAEELIP